MNKYGLPYVVDMDLSKCFDRLDHELILKSINTRVRFALSQTLMNRVKPSGLWKVVEESQILFTPPLYWRCSHSYQTMFLISWVIGYYFCLLCCLCAVGYSYIH